MNGKTATTDQERADTFADHMENTCKTPEGDQFDQKHKEDIENHVKSHPSVFNPFPEINNSAEVPIEQEITIEEIKNRLLATPNKGPWGQDFPPTFETFN